MTSATQTTQVYRVYIRASARAIWDAITSPEWTVKYGYQAPVDYELRPGGTFRGLASEAMKAHGAPEVVIAGEVLEVDPPHRLVQTWRPQWDAESAKEASKLTYEIVEQQDGLCRLTVTHEVDDAPLTAAMVGGGLEDTGAGGGWAQVLSDLKTLLETGQALYA